MEEILHHQGCIKLCKYILGFQPSTVAFLGGIWVLKFDFSGLTQKLLMHLLVPKIEVLTWYSPYVSYMGTAYVRENPTPKNSLTRFSTSILGTWNSWWLRERCPKLATISRGVRFRIVGAGALGSRRRYSCDGILGPVNLSWQNSSKPTLPETNSSHLKIGFPGFPKIKVIFQTHQFSGAMNMLVVGSEVPHELTSQEKEKTSIQNHPIFLGSTC